MKYSLTDIQKLLFKKATSYSPADNLSGITFVKSEEDVEDSLPVEEILSIENSSSNNKYSKSSKIKIFNDEDIPEGKARVGIDSLVKASAKLRHINQGLVKADERDSLRYKKAISLPELLAERIKLDAGKIKNSLMFKLSRVRSLKNFPPGSMNGYIMGHLLGNPLSFPSEELNPIFLNDQMRRISAFGMGGIGSVSALSKESQNVHPSQFSILDVVSTPDGARAGADLRIAFYTRIGKDGNFYTPLKNKKTGETEWLTPAEIEEYSVAFPD